MAAGPRRPAGAVKGAARALLLAARDGPGLSLTFARWVAQYRLGRALPAAASGPPREVPRVRGEELAAVFAARSPAVLPDLAAAWPDVFRWDSVRLRRELGDHAVQVFVGEGPEPDFAQAYFAKRLRSMRLADLLDVVLAERRGGERLYLWNFGNAALRERFLPADAVPRAVGAHALIARDTGPWIGEKGNVTGVHYDGWHGLLAQLEGRKRVLLFAPEEAPRLSAASPFGRTPVATTLPPAVRDAARMAAHPRFAEATRWEVVLAPGEVLYIPPFWWHHVECLDPALSFTVRYACSRREWLHPGAFPIRLHRARAALAQALRGGQEETAPGAG